MNPLTIRYNNPGALEYQPWMQKHGASVGENGRYASFQTPDAGFGVMGKVLDTYQNKHGLNTVADIVNRWAPANVDNNSTGQYMQFVANKLGMDPRAPLTAEQRPALMQAMAHYEAGKPFPSVSAQLPAQSSLATGEINGAMPSPTSAPTDIPMPAPTGGADTSLSGMFRQFSENPLLLAGLGIMSASGQGKDLGTAALTGIQSGQQGLKAADERMRKDALQRVLSGEGMAGVPPALLQLAQATGDPSPIAQHIIKGGGTDDIKEYEYARRNGFVGSLQDWLVNKRASQGEYAKQLVYGTDKAGNPVALQAGSRGDLVASKMPDGVTLQRDPIKLDLGDRYAIMDPTTRQIAGYVPKGLAEAEAQKQQGEARGKATVDLPRVESSVSSILPKIDAVLADPNLGNVTGWNAYLPTIKEASHDTETRIKQLDGTAFLSAFESLKGGGAITDVEGAKATLALSRLSNMKQSDAGYVESLKDFRNEVLRLQELARTRAGGVAVAPTSAGQPPAEKSVPREAVDLLRSNTSAQRRAQFDAEFGAGAAARVLGGN